MNNHIFRKKFIFVCITIIILLGCAKQNIERKEKIGRKSYKNDYIYKNNFPVKNFKSGIVALNVLHKDGSLYAASGFLLSSSLVATNYHVVAGNIKNINILWDISLKRRPITATIIKTNKDLDLAILKLEKETDAPFLTLATDGRLEYGEDIAIMGYPEITQPEDEKIKFVHLFKGNIASIINDYYGHPEKIVLDARVFKGTSGGPVFSIKTGKVIGIITEIILDSEEETTSLPSGKKQIQSVEGESVGIAIHSIFLSELLK